MRLLEAGRLVFRKEDFQTFFGLYRRCNGLIAKDIQYDRLVEIGSYSRCITALHRGIDRLQRIGLGSAQGGEKQTEKEEDDFHVQGGVGGLKLLLNEWKSKLYCPKPHFHDHRTAGKLNSFRIIFIPSMNSNRQLNHSKPSTVLLPDEPC